MYKRQDLNKASETLKGVKINKGEIKDKIDISVSKATQSSIKLIESLGGKIDLLEKSKEKKDLKKQPEEKEISKEAAETSIKDSADK